MADGTTPSQQIRAKVTGWHDGTAGSPGLEGLRLLGLVFAVGLLHADAQLGDGASDFVYDSGKDPFEGLPHAVGVALVRESSDRGHVDAAKRHGAFHYDLVGVVLVLVVVLDVLGRGTANLDLDGEVLVLKRARPSRSSRKPRSAGAPS
ncbi:hypothetical protein AB0P17_41680 [Streptomyces sp. NPDC088124]|uniref:hypothetical protein n=1 Tax=Streptomyces sp. NPDC088124 TaxID=3154654 RepID=UPI00343F9E10